MDPPYFGADFIVRPICQADSPLDPEACESHESTPLQQLCYTANSREFWSHR